MTKPIVVKVDKRIFKKCIKCRNWYRRVDLMGEVVECPDTGELTGGGGGELIEKRGFGKHSDSADGLQSICFACKNIMNNLARNRNIRARIRHHTGTRCLTQLGKELTPKNFVANLEDYLGYRISALVKHLSSDLKKREGYKRRLRDALNEGYHLDHIHPLSKFPVILVGEDGTQSVDWDAFRRCWEIKNLVAIPALENLQKGAKVKIKYEPKHEDNG